MTSLQINPSQITSLERNGKTLLIRMSDHSEITVEGWENPLAALAEQLSRGLVEILQETCTARVAASSGTAVTTEAAESQKAGMP